MFRITPNKKKFVVAAASVNAPSQVMASPFIQVKSVPSRTFQLLPI